MGEDKIQCHPSRAPFWQWPMVIIATIAIFGGAIFAGLFIISELVTKHQTTQQTKIILLAVGGVISILLLLIYIRWEQDRWYWILEEDKLIGGKKKDKVFPLSSIVAIVFGLPDKTNPLLAANKFVHPELWAFIMTERKLALLLKFADGSIMPFHVHKCVNGCLLMNELVTRFADRIDPEYQYTKQEVKALRYADWNRIVKQRIP